MSRILSSIDLELLAESFRQTNSLSITEPLRIKSLIQKLNILAVYRTLSSGFSGMSIKIVTENESNRFMLVNSDHSIGKQHFTICHELYHLYFQTNFQSKISCAGLFDKKGDPEEYNADVFASCILLPQMGVYKMIPDEERSKNKITIPTLLAIEQYYGCSHSALLHRLLNLNLIDKDHKEKFQNIGITNLARKLGYNTSLYEKGNNGEVIGKYGTLAYTSWERGIVSESSYYGLLSDLGIDVSKLDDVQINGDL